MYARVYVCVWYNINTLDLNDMVLFSNGYSCIPDIVHTSINNTISRYIIIIFKIETKIFPWKFIYLRLNRMYGHIMIINLVNQLRKIYRFLQFVSDLNKIQENNKNQLQQQHETCWWLSDSKKKKNLLNDVLAYAVCWFLFSVYSFESVLILPLPLMCAHMYTFISYSLSFFFFFLLLTAGYCSKDQNKTKKKTRKHENSNS